MPRPESRIGWRRREPAATVRSSRRRWPMGAERAGRAAALVLVAAILGTAGVADDAAPPDADLVAALGDAATRDSAADRLVARGAAATPALVTALADAKLRIPALEVLARIGP